MWKYSWSTRHFPICPPSHSSSDIFTSGIDGLSEKNQEDVVLVGFEWNVFYKDKTLWVLVNNTG